MLKFILAVSFIFMTQSALAFSFPTNNTTNNHGGHGGSGGSGGKGGSGGNATQGS